MLSGGVVVLMLSVCGFWACDEVSATDCDIATLQRRSVARISPILFMIDALRGL